MAAAASESVPLVTAGLQICLQGGRNGGGSLLANTSGKQLPWPPGRDGLQAQVVFPGNLGFGPKG